MSVLPFNVRRVLIIAGIVILVLMMMDFNNRLVELNRLKKQAQVLSVQATQLIATQQALLTEVAYAASDQAVEEWARREGHYVREGDQAVVPVPLPGSDPMQNATPTPTPTPLPNWQVWWNLFLGE
jgi:cell division protein FtsB